MNHEQTGKEKIYLYRTIRRELHNTELKFLWQEEDGRKLRQKLTLEFRNAVRDLPTSQNTAAYEQFISNYGTDISTRVRFGGQYVSSTSITKEFYERTGLTQTEFQAKASAMIGYAGSSASIGGGVGNREEKLRREFNKLNTSETTITVSGGAGITKEDEWERALENDPVPVFIEFASIAKLLTKEFFPKDPAIQQKQDLLIQALNYYFQKNGLQDKTAGADKNKFFAKAPRYYKVQPIGVRLDANDRKNGLNNFNYESVHLELKDADGTSIRRIPMDEARFVNRAEYKYFPLNEFKVGGTDRYLYSGIITVDGSIGDKNDVRNPLGPCKTCEDGVIDLGSLYQVGASVTGSMLYSGGKVPVYFSFKVTRISKDEFDQPVSSVQPPSHYNNTPLWRLYNGNAQNHFYTTSEVEVNGAKSIGYTGDGFIECYVLKSPQDDAVPLYRLFNPRVTDHYYTVNESEKNALVSQHGWSYEGIACYIFSSQVPGTVPLYSLYMGGSVQDHFYTTSPKEVEVAVTQIGFTLDNAVIGYVYPAYDIRNNK